MNRDEVNDLVNHNQYQHVEIGNLHHQSDRDERENKLENVTEDVQNN